MSVYPSNQSMSSTPSFKSPPSTTVEQTTSNIPLTSHALYHIRKIKDETGVSYFYGIKDITKCTLHVKFNVKIVPLHPTIFFRLSKLPQTQVNTHIPITINQHTLFIYTPSIATSSTIPYINTLTSFFAHAFPDHTACLTTDTTTAKLGVYATRAVATFSAEPQVFEHSLYFSQHFRYYLSNFARYDAVEPYYAHTDSFSLEFPPNLDNIPPLDYSKIALHHQSFITQVLYNHDIAAINFYNLMCQDEPSIDDSSFPWEQNGLDCDDVGYPTLNPNMSLINDSIMNLYLNLFNTFSRHILFSEQNMLFQSFLSQQVGYNTPESLVPKTAPLIGTLDAANVVVEHNQQLHLRHSNASKIRSTPYNIIPMDYHDFITIPRLVPREHPVIFSNQSINLEGTVSTQTLEYLPSIVDPTCVDTVSLTQQYRTFFNNVEITNHYISLYGYISSLTLSSYYNDLSYCTPLPPHSQFYQSPLIPLNSGNITSAVHVSNTNLTYLPQQQPQKTIVLHDITTTNLFSAADYILNHINIHLHMKYLSSSTQKPQHDGKSHQSGTPQPQHIVSLSLHNDNLDLVQFSTVIRNLITVFFQSILERTSTVTTFLVHPHSQDLKSLETFISSQLHGYIMRFLHFIPLNDYDMLNYYRFYGGYDEEANPDVVGTPDPHLLLPFVLPLIKPTTVLSQAMIVSPFDIDILNAHSVNAQNYSILSNALNSDLSLNPKMSNNNNHDTIIPMSLDHLFTSVDFTTPLQTLLYRIFNHQTDFSRSASTFDQFNSLFKQLSFLTKSVVGDKIYSLLCGLTQSVSACLFQNNPHSLNHHLFTAITHHNLANTTVNINDPTIPSTSSQSDVLGLTNGDKDNIQDIVENWIGTHTQSSPLPSMGFKNTFRSQIGTIDFSSDYIHLVLRVLTYEVIYQPKSMEKNRLKKSKSIPFYDSHIIVKVNCTDITSHFVLYYIVKKSDFEKYSSYHPVNNSNILQKSRSSSFKGLLNKNDEKASSFWDLSFNLAEYQNQSKFQPQIGSDDPHTPNIPPLFSVISLTINPSLWCVLSSQHTCDDTPMDNFSELITNLPFITLYNPYSSSSSNFFLQKNIQRQVIPPPPPSIPNLSPDNSSPIKFLAFSYVTRFTLLHEDYITKLLQQHYTTAKTYYYKHFYRNHQQYFKKNILFPPYTTVPVTLYDNDKLRLSNIYSVDNPLPCLKITSPANNLRDFNQSILKLVVKVENVTYSYFYPPDQQVYPHMYQPFASPSQSAQNVKLKHYQLLPIFQPVRVSTNKILHESSNPIDPLLTTTNTTKFDDIPKAMMCYHHLNSSSSSYLVSLTDGVTSTTMTLPMSSGSVPIHPGSLLELHLKTFIHQPEDTHPLSHQSIDDITSSDENLQAICAFIRSQENSHVNASKFTNQYNYSQLSNILSIFKLTALLLPKIRYYRRKYRNYCSQFETNPRQDRATHIQSKMENNLKKKLDLNCLSHFISKLYCYEPRNTFDIDGQTDEKTSQIRISSDSIYTFFDEQLSQMAQDVMSAHTFPHKSGYETEEEEQEPRLSPFAFDFLTKSMSTIHPSSHLPLAYPNLRRCIGQVMVHYRTLYSPTSQSIQKDVYQNKIFPFIGQFHQKNPKDNTESYHTRLLFHLQERSYGWYIYHPFNHIAAHRNNIVQHQLKALLPPQITHDIDHMTYLRHNHQTLTSEFTPNINSSRKENYPFHYRQIDPKNVAVEFITESPFIFSTGYELGTCLRKTPGYTSQCFYHLQEKLLQQHFLSKRDVLLYFFNKYHIMQNQYEKCLFSLINDTTNTLPISTNPTNSIKTTATRPMSNNSPDNPHFGIKSLFDDLQNTKVSSLPIAKRVFADYSCREKLQKSPLDIVTFSHHPNRFENTLDTIPFNNYTLQLPFFVQSIRFLDSCSDNPNIATYNEARVTFIDISHHEEIQHGFDFNTFQFRYPSPDQSSHEMDHFSTSTHSTTSITVVYNTILSSSHEKPKKISKLLNPQYTNVHHFYGINPSLVFEHMWYVDPPPLNSIVILSIPSHDCGRNNLTNVTWQFLVLPHSINTYINQILSLEHKNIKMIYNDGETNPFAHLFIDDHKNGQNHSNNITPHIAPNNAESQLSPLRFDDEDHFQTEESYLNHFNNYLHYNRLSVLSERDKYLENVRLISNNVTKQLNQISPSFDITFLMYNDTIPIIPYAYMYSNPIHFQNHFYQQNTQSPDPNLDENYFHEQNLFTNRFSMPSSGKNITQQIPNSINWAHTAVKSAIHDKCFCATHSTTIETHHLSRLFYHFRTKFYDPLYYSSSFTHFLFSHLQVLGLYPSIDYNDFSKTLQHNKTTVKLSSIQAVIPKIAKNKRNRKYKSINIFAKNHVDTDDYSHFNEKNPLNDSASQTSQGGVSHSNTSLASITTTSLPPLLPQKRFSTLPPDELQSTVEQHSSRLHSTYQETISRPISSIPISSQSFTDHPKSVRLSIGAPLSASIGTTVPLSSSQFSTPLSTSNFSDTQRVSLFKVLHPTGPLALSSTNSSSLIPQFTPSRVSIPQFPPQVADVPPIPSSALSRQSFSIMNVSLLGTTSTDLNQSFSQSDYLNKSSLQQPQARPFYHLLQQQQFGPNNSSTTGLHLSRQSLNPIKPPQQRQSHPATLVHEYNRNSNTTNNSAEGESQRDNPHANKRFRSSYPK